MFGLRELLEGGMAQANPFDGGKTFGDVNRPMPQKRALPMREMARPMRQSMGRMQQRQPIPPRPGYYPQRGGVELWGARTNPNFHIEEDDVSFPRGGQFQRLPGGRTYLNGAFLPDGDYAEDDFEFPQFSAERYLRQLLGL